VATTFSEALSRAPMRTFSVVTFAICMLVLVADGVDAQLLGIVAPKVIEDFGVDRGIFGWAMMAALVGFGLGSWGGGWLGDTIGRRYSLALAAAVFSLATVGASWSQDVWQLAAWRLLGGIGFGSAYANAITLASEWLPDRWRSVAVTTLSVGTPAGGTVVGWIAPGLVAEQGWRGAFVVIGAATLVIVVVILAVLRDSPSFLLARGKAEEAKRAAARVLEGDFELVPERHHADSAGDGSIGVLHPANARLNLGVGVAFAACAMCAYGILNWSTTFLTTKGFTLEQAGNAVSIGGLTSIAASILAGLLVYRLGSKAVMVTISGLLFVLLIAFGFAVETLPPAPNAGDRLPVVVLLGTTAAVFSAGIASMYALMTYGYPPSCRSAGIGFGIFMSRVGAVAASGLGGVLLEWGGESVVPFFAVLTVSAGLALVGTLIVDRHVPPSAKRA
jgi:AAHS family 4-hydroxybenzoate transporter-like MFS transporter